MHFDDNPGCIVKFIGATTRTEFVGTESKNEITTILLFELVEGGDLLKYIFNGARPFPEPLALFITRSLIIGIDYAHSKGVSLLDIKPDNILFCGKLDLSNWKYWVKQCDCGLSKLSEGPFNSFQGTRDYMSPQVLFSKTYYGEESDLFSLAVCIFMMVVGRRPFFRANPYNLPNIRNLEQDSDYVLLVTGQHMLFWSNFEA